MKERCIQAVSEALGRQINQQEAKDIESRILKNMRIGARQDPTAWQALTADERLQEAARMAATDLVQEANKKKERMILTIKAVDRLKNYINEAKQSGLEGLDAVERTLVFKSDRKSNTISAETKTNAIKANAIRQLVDTFTAVSPKLLGLLEDKEGQILLTKAIFGERTGIAEIDKGAQAWLDVSNQLREQFNKLGGMIGKLEDWAVPQHHSQIKVLKAGPDQWIRDIMPNLKREKYVNEDGTLMNDTQLTDFLNAAWKTIATGGINKVTPGAPKGTKAVSSRRMHSREIHFKDATSYLDYQRQYGDKTLWGVITGHIEGISKELGMLDTYGPNPDNTFRLLAETEMVEAADLDPAKAAKIEHDTRNLLQLYDFVSGKTQPIVNKQLAQTFDTLRNWMVASRLGSAVITALTDQATINLTAHVNNLPQIELFRNQLAALNILNKTEENLAYRAGIGVDTLLGHLNRWGTENLGPTVSSKVASTVMRLSGLEALDGARRRAFGATYMSALGEMVGKYDTLADLDLIDNKILLSKGITETDWQTWKQASLEDWGKGNKVLTPESIMQIEGVDEQVKNDAVLRLLGVILEETDMAVIKSGAKDKARTGAGVQRGTWKGELVRSFFQFKSFPLAMISRHWMRGIGMDKAAGKVAYIGSLIAATTVLGVVSQSINDLLQGKEVRNYDPTKPFGTRNWIAAFLKGGSLGIYGDFLFSGATQSNQSGPIASALGPVAGLTEEAFKITQGNIVEAMQGKDTNIGAEMVRFAKGNIPGASLWYTKAAMDHIIFHNLQEYFSPGYLASMERRAQTEFGQSYWWKPGTGIEGMQAPELAKAFGE